MVCHSVLTGPLKWDEHVTASKHGKRASRLGVRHDIMPVWPDESPPPNEWVWKELPEAPQPVMSSTDAVGGPKSLLDIANSVVEARANALGITSSASGGAKKEETDNKVKPEVK